MGAGLHHVGEVENMATLIAFFRSPTFWVCLLAGVLVCVGVSELLAQAPSVPPSVPPSLPPSVPPAGGGSGIIETGRSLTFEWIITAAMCGLALFVVCRSSNRN